jgi:hypothetical protein
MLNKIIRYYLLREVVLKSSNIQIADSKISIHAFRHDSFVIGKLYLCARLNQIFVLSG